MAITISIIRTINRFYLLLLKNNTNQNYLLSLSLSPFFPPAPFKCMCLNPKMNEHSECNKYIKKENT